MARLRYVEKEISLEQALYDITVEGAEDHRIYMVYLCGCTDCFPHAVFMELKKAEEWGQNNSHNPEGWFIHTILLDRKE